MRYMREKYSNYSRYTLDEADATQRKETGNLLFLLVSVLSNILQTYRMV